MGVGVASAGFGVPVASVTSGSPPPPQATADSARLTARIANIKTLELCLFVMNVVFSPLVCYDTCWISNRTWDPYYLTKHRFPHTRAGGHAGTQSNRLGSGPSRSAR
jgi:hypothetical protein